MYPDRDGKRRVLGRTDSFAGAEASTRRWTREGVAVQEPIEEGEVGREGVQVR